MSKQEFEGDADTTVWPTQFRQQARDARRAELARKARQRRAAANAKRQPVGNSPRPAA